MNTGRRVLLWAPRLLLIVFALFLIIFSFDVFEEGKTVTEIGIDFFMHNIPSLVLGLAVIVAWRREWVGTVTCLLLAAVWIAWAWGRFPIMDHYLPYLFIPGPLFLVGALYAVNWHHRKITT